MFDPHSEERWEPHCSMLQPSNSSESNTVRLCGQMASIHAPTTYDFIMLDKTKLQQICWFLGTQIWMGLDEHPEPHFHAIYEDLEPNPQAVYSIDTLEVIEGSLPEAVNDFVMEWMIDHRQDLRDNWLRAIEGKPLQEIEALEGTF